MIKQKTYHFKTCLYWRSPNLHWVKHERPNTPGPHTKSHQHQNKQMHFLTTSMTYISGTFSSPNIALLNLERHTHAVNLKLKKYSKGQSANHQIMSLIDGKWWRNCRAKHEHKKHKKFSLTCLWYYLKQNYQQIIEDRAVLRSALIKDVKDVCVFLALGFFFKGSDCAVSVTACSLRKVFKVAQNPTTQSQRCHVYLLFSCKTLFF